MDTMGYNKASDINPRLLQLSAIATLMHVLNISVMHKQEYTALSSTQINF